MQSILVDISRWIFWGPLRKIVFLMSPRYISTLEGLFSFFSYYILISRRKVITQELRKSFGNKWSSERIEKAVRESFRIYFASKFRMFYLPKLNSSNMGEYIEVQGLGYLEKELAKKKGVIVLNPHFGPFMLIMPALGYRGYRINQLALQGPPLLRQRKWMEKKAYDVKYRNIELHMPVKFINAAEGILSLRDAYKVLENNEILLFPSTGRGGKVWHTVNFMRRKALFTPVPFRIALKTGASLLPAFVFCCGEKISVRFDEPIKVDHDSTAEGLVEKYVKILDSYVERYPEHFLMYIYEMRVKSNWDDHPFFVDYKQADDYQNTRTGYA